MINIKITGSGSLSDLAEELQQIQEYISNLTNTEAESGGCLEQFYLMLEYSREDGDYE